MAILRIVDTTDGKKFLCGFYAGSSTSILYNPCWLLNPDFTIYRTIYPSLFNCVLTDNGWVYANGTKPNGIPTFDSDFDGKYNVTIGYDGLERGMIQVFYTDTDGIDKRIPFSGWGQRYYSLKVPSFQCDAANAWLHCKILDLWNNNFVLVTKHYRGDDIRIWTLDDWEIEIKETASGDWYIDYKDSGGWMASNYMDIYRNTDKEPSTLDTVATNPKPDGDDPMLKKYIKFVQSFSGCVQKAEESSWHQNTNHLVLKMVGDWIILGTSKSTAPYLYLFASKRDEIDFKPVSTLPIPAASPTSPGWNGRNDWFGDSRFWRDIQFYNGKYYLMTDKEVWVYTPNGEDTIFGEFGTWNNLQYVIDAPEDTPKAISCGINPLVNNELTTYTIYSGTVTACMTAKELKICGQTTYPSGKFDLSDANCVCHINQEQSFVAAVNRFATILIGCNNEPYLRLFKLYPIHHPENETTNGGNGFTSLMEWREETDRMDFDTKTKTEAEEGTFEPMIDGPVTGFASIYSPKIGAIPLISKSGVGGINYEYPHPDKTQDATYIKDWSFSSQIIAAHIDGEIKLLRPKAKTLPNCDNVYPYNAKNVASYQNVGSIWTVDKCYVHYNSTKIGNYLFVDDDYIDTDLSCDFAAGSIQTDSIIIGTGGVTYTTIDTTLHDFITINDGKINTYRSFPIPTAVYPYATQPQNQFRLQKMKHRDIDDVFYAEPLAGSQLLVFRNAEPYFEIYKSLPNDGIPHGLINPVFYVEYGYDGLGERKTSEFVVDLEYRCTDHCTQLTSTANTGI